MVNPGRSILTRVYLYAAAVMILTSAAIFFIGRAMVDEGRIDAMRQFGEDQTAYIGREVESSITHGVPDDARMRDLSESLHVQLAYVPWGDRGAYPAELASEKIYTRATDRPGPWLRRFWVRLDVAGQPQGALRVQFQQPRGPRPGGPHRLPITAALGWMAILAFMVIPPLWWWVLRPLNRMVAIADRLGHGDLETPVPVDRKDEFGELERAFETMRQRVQQMITGRERLLRDISHELRAPLSRMAIALPLAREEAPSPYLDTLERDMGTMDTLIGEVLALARGRSPEALNKEPVDLAALAQALLDEREIVLARRSAPVERALAPARVSGDRRLLMRAMGNLLDNALKYTPDTASIRLETVVDGESATFRVVDRGPGIPAADLPQLFEPFYRPDTSRSRETGGTGLGLAIVKAIAEAHGGQATIASVEGQGTTAAICLPGI